MVATVVAMVMTDCFILIVMCFDYMITKLESQLSQRLCDLLNTLLEHPFPMTPILFQAFGNSHHMNVHKLTPQVLETKDEWWSPHSLSSVQVTLITTDVWL